ncbi:MAG: RHS repeat-associated core domain-containing protein, partial [Chlamydiales bacterium]
MNEQNQIDQLRVLGEGLGAEIGAAVLYELEGVPYMPIHDHRGCIVVLIDVAVNEPVECYRYTAFGEELTGDTLSPWRFSSKRVEEETDLVFFGRRYYQPVLGRWIT